MTWVLVDDDGNERTFDSKTEAQDQQQSMKQLGKDVDILPVDEATGAELQGDGDDVDAEVIEMSGDGGNTDSDDDDSNDDLEIVGDGGRPYVYCPNCERLSTCVYRCPDPLCGADLAGKPFYRGDVQ